MTTPTMIPTIVIVLKKPAGVEDSVGVVEIVGVADIVGVAGIVGVTDIVGVVVVELGVGEEDEESKK